MIAAALAAVLTLAALGDSLTVGRFASTPCVTPQPIAPSACPSGTGYVDVMARMLARANVVRYENLARPGAHTNLVALEQAPRIAPEANVVTVFVGWTDEAPVARGDYPLETWKEDYDWAIAAIRVRVPHARLLLATLPNAAWSPLYVPGGAAAMSRLMRRRVGEAAAAMNAYILTRGAAVVDLRCMPEFYDARWLHAQDDVHFDDAGYQLLGERFARAVTRPQPPAVACAPYSDPPPLDTWWSPFLIAAARG